MFDEMRLFGVEVFCDHLKATLFWKTTQQAVNLSKKLLKHGRKTAAAGKKQVAAAVDTASDTFAPTMHNSSAALQFNHHHPNLLNFSLSTNRHF